MNTFFAFLRLLIAPLALTEQGNITENVHRTFSVMFHCSVSARGAMSQKDVGVIAFKCAYSFTQ